MATLEELRQRAKEARRGGKPRPRSERRSKVADPPSDIWRPQTYQVGITTSPRRRPRLLETIASTVAAGWPEMRVFADGDRGDVAGVSMPLPDDQAVTERGEWIGGPGNFILGLAELYQRDPHVDAYVMLQDDQVHSHHVRAYIERVGLPADGSVFSWYCPGRKRKYNHPNPGWHRVAAGQGLVGALTYLFTNEAAAALLASPYVVKYRRGEDSAISIRSKGLKHIDGMVGEWARRTRRKVYYHSPSLAQHTGDTSTIHLKASATGNRRASTFKDDSAFRVAAKRDDGPRVGLVGWNTHTGLGTLNRTLCEQLPIATWLVLANPNRTNALPPQWMPATRCKPTNRDVIAKWMRSVDVVLFAESPYSEAVIESAVELGKRIVCIPMAERLSSSAPWVKHVDEFLFPTSHGRIKHNWAPGRYVPWPVDVDSFQFKLREWCESFVYVNGTGGVHDRKGAAIVAAAAKLAPDVPLTVYSQVPFDWPSHVDVRGEVKDNRDLYADGSVCVQPSRFEGIGLQLLECQAAGMPLVTTDAPPMNEYQPLRAIPVANARTFIIRGCETASHTADAGSLAAAMRELYRSDIGEASRAARAFAESRSWSRLGEQLRLAIQNKKARQDTGNA